MKLSFNRKIDIKSPVRDLQVSDAEHKQSFLNQPGVQEYMKRVEARSFEEGYQKGLLEGTKKKEEELQSLLQVFRKSLQDLKVSEKQLVQQLEPQVIDLCVRAAKTVIGREIDEKSADLENIIKPILAHVPDASRIIIKVNPRDLNQLREFSNDIVDDGKIESLEVVSDANISRGGCVIETDVGTIDATLETRVSQMSQSLQGEGTEP